MVMKKEFLELMSLDHFISSNFMFDLVNESAQRDQLVYVYNLDHLDVHYSFLLTLKG